MSRQYYAGRNLSRAITIEDLRRMARRRLPAFSYEYLEGGAEDEVSLAHNRESFQAHDFLPRQLVKVDQVNTATQLFGRPLATPMIIAPTSTGNSGAW